MVWMVCCVCSKSLRLEVFPLDFSDDKAVLLVHRPVWYMYVHLHVYFQGVTVLASCKYNKEMKTAMLIYI